MEIYQEIDSVVFDGLFVSALWAFALFTLRKIVRAEHIHITTYQKQQLGYPSWNEKETKLKLVIHN